MEGQNHFLVYYFQCFASRRCNNLSESIKRPNTSDQKAFSFGEAQPLWFSFSRSHPSHHWPGLDESAGNDYRDRGTEKRSTRIDPRCFSLAAPHRSSFFLSLVIIITDARVHASAMERIDRRTIRRWRRRWRRRMWSSRHVWSDVCPVCGGMRKTGSLYVLHARRLPKPSPSLRAAFAHARAYVYTCHDDTDVRGRVQSRAS